MRVWDDGCVLWCVGGTGEDGKMTVLQFQQLMLVPFGPTFSRCKKSCISLRCKISYKTFWLVRFFTDSHIEGLHLGEM